MTVGVANDGDFFGDLGGYFFGNVRDKTSCILWPVIDCKMNDLE